MLLVAFCQAVAAQETPQTLLNMAGEEKMSTFYWGPEFKLHFHGRRMEQFASPLIGGKMGLIINRKLILGVGGWGKVGRTTFYGRCVGHDDDGQLVDIPNQKMAYGYGYGGLILGYVHQSNKAIHFTFTSVFGGGTCNEFIIEADGDHGTTFNSPGFFLIEPTLNVEINLTARLRMEAGVGYRWMSGNRFRQLSTSELSGFTVPIALKIGKY